MTEMAAALRVLMPAAEPRGIDKHVQTLGIALVLGVSGWIMNSTIENGKLLVAIQATQTAIQDASKAAIDAQNRQNDRFDRRIHNLEDWRHRCESGSCRTTAASDGG